MNTELLKPRIKLIAPIPFFENKVGEILESTSQGIFIDPEYEENSSFCIIWENVDNYPHLFKKLDWWEEIKEGDMPEYVKYIGNKNDGFYNHVLPHSIYKVLEYENHIIYLLPSKAGLSMNRFKFLPATKEEYDNQNKQK